MLFWNDETRPRLERSILSLLGEVLADVHLPVNQSQMPTQHLELLTRLERSERARAAAGLL